MEETWRDNGKGIQTQACFCIALQLCCSFHNSETLKSSLVWHWRLYTFIPLICRVSGISQRTAFTSLWWIQNVKIIQKLIFIIFLQERKCLLKYQTSVVGWDNCAKDNVTQGKKISCLPCPRRPQRIWDYNHFKAIVLWVLRVSSTTKNTITIFVQETGIYE